MKTLTSFKLHPIFYYLIFSILFFACEQDEIQNDNSQTQSRYIEDTELINYISTELERYDNRGKDNENLSGKKTNNFVTFNEVREYLDERGIDYAMLNQTVDDIEYANLDDPIQNAKNSGRFTQKQINLTAQFAENLNENGNLSIAIQELESSVNETSLNGEEQRVMHNMLTIFKSINKPKRNSAPLPLTRSGFGQKSCAGGVIGLTFAFAGLAIAGTAAIGTAGGATPAVWFAAANFVRASISAGVACRSRIVAAELAPNYIRNNIRETMVLKDFSKVSLYTDLLRTDLINGEDLRNLALYRGTDSSKGVGIMLLIEDDYYSKETPFLKRHPQDLDANTIRDKYSYIEVGSTSIDNVCTETILCRVTPDGYE